MKNREVVSTEIDPKRDYTSRELDAIADQILRDDSKTELCRACGERGEATGNVRSEAQDEKDDAGRPLVVDFGELCCSNGHTWYQGEGKYRGIAGDNPILFEEHIQSRKRREIHCKIGIPDPEIVSGIFNRIHQNGRKVNSPEQRARGSSFYR